MCLLLVHSSSILQDCMPTIVLYVPLYNNKKPCRGRCLQATPKFHLHPVIIDCSPSNTFVLSHQAYRYISTFDVPETLITAWEGLEITSTSFESYNTRMPSIQLTDMTVTCPTFACVARSSKYSKTVNRDQLKFRISSANQSQEIVPSVELTIVPVDTC